MSSLRCLFTVQGEGRGHMTQALALKNVLEQAGHRVTGVVMGRSEMREVPRFFLDGIGAPVTYVASPNFVADARGRSVRLLSTLWHNARRAGRFRESLRTLDALFDAHRPDVVVNFFEPLTGLYYRRHAPAAPMVCVGHQYIFEHPAYEFPPGHAVSQSALRFFTRLTAGDAARKLALSLYPARDLPQKNLAVMPPLLRKEVSRLSPSRHEPFVLIYLLNSGYADEIVRWHEAHPEVALHCFWDRAGAPTTRRHDETLTFHRLDDKNFLSMMARCRGLVCTAGFESIGEAMYLGKPVLMVPVEGHYEQRCNALDGVRAGAGLRADHFEIHRLLDHLPAHEHPSDDFRQWVDGAEARFLAAVEDAAGYERRPAEHEEELLVAA